MNSIEFKKVLNDSKPGAPIVYFTGCLTLARKDSDGIDRLAETVWKAAGMRWNPNAKPAAKDGHQGQWQATGDRRVALTQRRLSEPLGWEYVATKL